MFVAVFRRINPKRVPKAATGDENLAKRIFMILFV
jgi:hypothetical protein